MFKRKKKNGNELGGGDYAKRIVEAADFYIRKSLGIFGIFGKRKTGE